jgi:hypothetical protein
MTAKKPSKWRKEALERIKDAHYDDTGHPFEGNCCYECVKMAFDEAEEHFNKPLQELPRPQRLNPNEIEEIKLALKYYIYHASHGKSMGGYDDVCGLNPKSKEYKLIKSALDKLDSFEKEVSRLEAEKKAILAKIEEIVRTLDEEKEYYRKVGPKDMVTVYNKIMGMIIKKSLEAKSDDQHN